MEKIIIGILYNIPQAKAIPSPDLLSEEGVLAEVEAVRGALEALGLPYDLLPVEKGIEPVLGRIKQVQPGVIFNLAEGVDGDSQKEMYLPAMLELLGIPYTGSPSLTLGMCLDKGRTKALLSAAGISTPHYRIADNPTSIPDGLHFPLIVKPVHEDASLGISDQSVVYDERRLAEQIARVVSDYSQPALVEEYIEGREFNVSIIGNQPPRVLPVSELNFSALPESQPQICSYQPKWASSPPEHHGVKVNCPADISPVLLQKIELISIGAYRAMGCRDYARIDIRMDNEQNVYVLEVNPNPDISLGAGLARSVQKSGLSYCEFIEMVLNYAWDRKTSCSPPIHRDF